MRDIFGLSTIFFLLTPANHQVFGQDYGSLGKKDDIVDVPGASPC